MIVRITSQLNINDYAEILDAIISSRYLKTVTFEIMNRKLYHLKFSIMIYDFLLNRTSLHYSVNDGHIQIESDLDTQETPESEYTLNHT